MHAYYWYSNNCIWLTHRFDLQYHLILLIFCTMAVWKLLRHLLLFSWINRYTLENSTESRSGYRLIMQTFFKSIALLDPSCQLTNLPFSSDPEQPQTYRNVILIRLILLVFVRTERKTYISLHYSFFCFLKMLTFTWPSIHVSRWKKISS